MARTTDPRHERSRRRLIEAAATFMESDELDKISITAVVATAGVTRPTFYEHFGDLGTLYRVTALHRLTDAFPEPPAPSEQQALSSATRETWVNAAFETVSSLLGHLHDHAGFYRRALAGPSGAELHADVVVMLTRRILDESPIGPVMREAGEKPNDRATITAGGVVWLLLQWLETDFTGFNSVPAMSQRVSQALIDLSGTFAPPAS